MFNLLLEKLFNPLFNSINIRFSFSNLKFIQQKQKVSAVIIFHSCFFLSSSFNFFFQTEMSVCRKIIKWMVKIVFRFDFTWCFVIYSKKKGIIIVIFMRLQSYMSVNIEFIPCNRDTQHRIQRFFHAATPMKMPRHLLNWFSLLVILRVPREL